MFIRFLISILLLFVLSPGMAFADTTSFRSAGWVATDERFADHYTNLSGCQTTDGIYCFVQRQSGGMNLYFSSFGTLADFGIPKDSTITTVHLRIKGKNNVIQRIYLDRGRNKNPLSQLCQYPFDLWQLYLGPIDATREFHTLFTPYLPGNNLGNCFTSEIIDAQNFTFSIYDIESYSWFADIDNFEVAFDYTPPAPTPTPTPSAVPTPEPFLDLPWDYAAEGMSFSEAALMINSYFDHTYPLLSSGLSETAEFLNQITVYRGTNKKDLAYSSHDGYDYGLPANIKFGDPVLAAAAGTARLVKEVQSSGGGNVIKIDHGNGYQTWYEHLQVEGLAIKNEGEELHVEKGQYIGKVGSTGNCWSPDNQGKRIYNTPTCAHIHFSVVQDKNKDGNFEDNIPDGMVDPFGWQSTDPDPWENYSFFSNGQPRTGNKSYYLWKKKIDGLQANLPTNGGIFHIGKTTITFPQDNTRSDLTLSAQAVPHVTVSSSLVSLGSTISIIAKNIVGDTVKFLAKPMTITIDFSDMDLSRFDLGRTTFAIYSSEDGEQWTKEPTVIDQNAKTATSQISHLTYFALLAERRDTVVPTTTFVLAGEKGQENWYRSDVTVSFLSTDNTGGLGVENTFYKKDEEDWQIYTTPLKFTTEGHHSVSYYAVDKDGNTEAIQTVSFTIDKIAPEAVISYDLTRFALQIVGKDTANTTVVSNHSLVHPQFTIIDNAGNRLVLNADKVVIGKQASMSIKKLTYNKTSPISFENNIFFTLVVTDKQNKIKQLDQYYSLKDDKRVFSNYVFQNNTTKISTKAAGQTRSIQETKQGVVLLKLYTQNGTLKYSY